MKKALKWIGIILLSIIILIAVLVFMLKSKFEKAQDLRHDFTVTSIAIPTDSASLARGEVLAESCKTCHGGHFDGLDFFNDEALGYMASPNISNAAGSATENYTDDDWIKALRHGLNPEGRPLMVMPSENFCFYSDEDLGSLIAFLKSVPKKEKPMGSTDFTLLAKVLGGAGQLGELYAFDKIDHEKARSVASIPLSENTEYGKYMVDIHGCKTCHGPNLNGGKSPDPVSPLVPNITKNSRVGEWTFEQFQTAVTTGIKPDGKAMDAKFMPWPGLRVHDTIEILSIYNYIHSIPGMEDHASVSGKIKY